MSRKTVRRASPAENHKLGKILETHLEIIRPMEHPDGGLVRYREAWDDEKIALLIAEDFSYASVQNYRTKVFGNLYYRTGAEQAETDTLRAELAETRKDLAETRRVVDVLRANFNRALLKLAINGNGDLKHLLLKEPDGSVPGIASQIPATMNGGKLI